MSKMTGLKPRERFFLVAEVINSDGSLDSRDGFEAFKTEEEALACAREHANEHGIESFIYECHPVKRVYRTSVVVEHL